MGYSEEKFTTKVNALLESNEDKCAMIATLLGVSANLTEYIFNECHKEDLPPIVQYAMAITAGNLLGFTCDGHERKIVRMPDDREYQMSEQTQELIYRKMKMIIEGLYKQIQDNEK